MTRGRLVVWVLVGVLGLLPLGAVVWAQEQWPHPVLVSGPTFDYPGAYVVSFSSDDALLSCGGRTGEGVYEAAVFDMETGEMTWHYTPPQLIATSLGGLLWPIANPNTGLPLPVADGPVAGWGGVTAAFLSPQDRNRMIVVHNVCQRNHASVREDDVGGRHELPGYWEIGAYLTFYTGPGFDFGGSCELDEPVNCMSAKSREPTLPRIVSVDVSPGGAFVATGDDAGYLTLWRQPGRPRLRQVRASDEPVYAVAFSPDGRLIATAGRMVRLWSTADLDMVAELPQDPVEHPELACWVDFTPDGSRVVSHGAPDLVRVWDTLNGEALGEFHLPPNSTGSYRFAFAGASDWLYAAGWANGTRLSELDLTTGALKPLCALPAAVSSLVCSRSKKHLAVACGRDRAMTWYLKDPDEE